jgi:hypothetical protein
LGLASASAKVVAIADMQRLRCCSGAARRGGDARIRTHNFD